MVPVRLTGPRLAVREYHHTEEEVDALHALFGDPEVTRHLPFGPSGREDCADQIELYLEEAMAEERDTYRLAVTRIADAEEPGDATPIGQAALTLDGHGAADLGCVLARGSWGRGYAGETVGLLRDFAFGTLGLHRLTARTAAANPASGRVLTRLGFRPEGRPRSDGSEGGVRSAGFAGGDRSDTYLFTLLAEEWPGPAARVEGG
ncbi:MULTISPECIES: GNAT family N-acetyltransferase [Streptomycetaceae]|uniref:GNAT family N-acetyltransferase n=1 Tax=Streptomycetaceae TaxID=2062 RepID=UPI00093CAE13|nr:GNAT family protein [Streptomyces sp. CB02056]